MKALSKAVLCLAVIASVSACTNTVRGVGQDTENAGQHIENSADR